MQIQRIKMFNLFKKVYYKLLGKDYRIYSNDLIKHLEYQHKQLFSIYTDLLKGFKTHNEKKVIKDLNEIRQNYVLHIDLENKRLYKYLLNIYKNTPEITQWIKMKQEEMEEITKVFNNFYKKYSNLSFLKTNFDNGLNELEQIGNALTKRVTMEQNKLYKLYVNKENLNSEELESLIS